MTIVYILLDFLIYALAGVGGFVVMLLFALVTSAITREEAVDETP